MPLIQLLTRRLSGSIVFSESLHGELSELPKPIILRDKIERILAKSYSYSDR